MSLESLSTQSWDADKNCLWFQVDDHGQTISCCVDAMGLVLALGARTPCQIDAINAYISRRDWIHAAALVKAARGDFERQPVRPQAFVHLTARDL
jgi:hypothetical protein